MKNLKIIPPTLREKKRYIYFQVIPEPGESFTYSDLEGSIWNTLLDFYGERGVAEISLWILKDTWNPEKLTCVIKCNNKSTERVIAGLGLIDRLGDNRICFKILGVSGTIRGLGVNLKRGKRYF
ncbi:MAG: Rpp14/Pop5 family protein [Candidatus Aenigmatarchaeota archaeon]